MRLIHRHSCEYSRGLLLIAGHVVAFSPSTSMSLLGNALAT